MPSRRPATDLPSDARAPGWPDRAPARAQEKFARAAAARRRRHGFRGWRRRCPASAASAATRVMISGGTGSSARSNEMARFCATVIASSSTMRSLTMPKRSTKASHSSLSAMALVGRPRLATSPLSGSDAPVIRLTNTSAAGRSKPRSIVMRPAGTRRARTRSGRSPPYCFSTSVRTRGSGTTAAAGSLLRRRGRFR